MDDANFCEPYDIPKKEFAHSIEYESLTPCPDKDCAVCAELAEAKEALADSIFTKMKPQRQRGALILAGLAHW